MANIAVAELTQRLHTRFHLPVGVRHRIGRDPFPTGLPTVDKALGGGFPRGALSEISGAQSSNRTALVTSALAHSTALGECGAWIDATGAFDPESAASAGVQLDRLLWVNCRGNTEHSCKATDLLLHGGGFSLIVFDLADIPDSTLRRIPLASWFRLRRAAQETGTALIVVTSRPQTGSWAAVAVQVSREHSLWKGSRFCGLASVLESRKHNGSISFTSAS